jgi:hypothetical protein
MNEKTQKDVLDHLQTKFDALPAGAVLVPPTDDSDVEDVEFNDPKVARGLIERGSGVLVDGETRDFYIYPVDEDVIYTSCPLCGDTHSIYCGNRFYTRACCYLDAKYKSENIGLQVERWTTEHLLARESVDEVHAKLTGLRGGRTLTRRDYVERINAILNDPRTTDSYKKYLETGDDGSIGGAQQERDYYMDEDYIITAEEDTEHEKAADAAEVQE